MYKIYSLRFVKIVNVKSLLKHEHCFRLFLRFNGLQALTKLTSGQKPKGKFQHRSFRCVPYLRGQGMLKLTGGEEPGKRSVISDERISFPHLKQNPATECEQWAQTKV